MEDKTADKSAAVVAVIAGLIAAVVESRELQNRSPRVRLAISDSVTIAKMVIAETKARK